jgi:ATP-binding cassette subfamily B protein
VAAEHTWRHREKRILEGAAELGWNARHVLAPFLRRQWRALVVAGASTVVVAAAEVLRPFPIKFAIDHLVEAGSASESVDVGRDDFTLLAGVAGLVLAIALMEAAGGYLMDVRLLRAGERIVHDLRIAMYAHLQRLSLGSHQQRHTGDLATRVTGDVTAVETLFSPSLGTLVSSGLALIGMTVVGLILDPVLALVAFATAALLGVIAFRERTSEERPEAGDEAALVEGRFTRVIDVVGAVGTAAVLVVGVLRVEAGALSAGGLVVMVLYARRIHRPLRSMAREWVRLSGEMARAGRVAEVLSADELLAESVSAQPDGSASGALEFDRVSFVYAAGRQALSNVSLQIPAGKRVAVVGRSGAGKSTLAALAARFYDPSAGRVLIDGVDTRDYPLPWLREQIGFVLHDPVLFTGTVAENIAWGIEASAEAIVQAAKAVGADEFILELPEEYDCELDPGATRLSGEQRQRIAMARTLLGDPAILILDEPTTGLDVESEAEVLDCLEVLMRGRTTVILSEALALARRADWVVVLDAGHVVQSGAPNDLLDQRGLFRRLTAEQGLVDKRPSRGPQVIADPDLPATRVMLDADAVAPVLARSFEGGAHLEVDVCCVRYKPGTNLVVHYEVEADGAHHEAVGMIVSGNHLARRAAKPENLALARQVGDRVAAGSPLAYDAEVGCLVQWYPLDVSLPTLALGPDRLRGLLAGAGIPVELSNEEPERLAYEPRRRAVLRIDGHVVRLYREAEFERALAGQRAAGGLGSFVTPRLEAELPYQLLTVQPLLQGHAVPSAEIAAVDAGGVLAALHASEPKGLAAFRPAEQLEAAAATAQVVGAIAPKLRPRIARLLASLADSMPEGVALVPSHGDFNARQLLIGPSGLAVTDFDEFCLAPTALDPATYAAYLVRGRPGNLEAALSALDDLALGYGERPSHLSWFLATMSLRRAAQPFRQFEKDWRSRVEEMVVAAEAAVDA